MKNIVLIGMPGVGKSTVGVILAKILNYDFVDCDLVIQKKTGKLLSEIIKEKGSSGFIKTENQIIASLKLEKTVIATGGSAVYGKEAMENLKKSSVVVYLELELNSLKKRLSDIKNRGVVIKDGQSIDELFYEREALYKKYADIIVCEDGLNVEETIEKIRFALDNLN
ncbi:MAG: shikimate kinase [Oscillospiraceae bacterium]|nr:shikimate kinase [Oscillospiraceae bacterium]